MSPNFGVRQPPGEAEKELQGLGSQAVPHGGCALGIDRGKLVPVLAGSARVGE